MDWVWIIPALIAGIIAYIIIRVGTKVNGDSHRKKGIQDYSPDFSGLAVDSSFLGCIVSFFVLMFFSLTIGLVIKVLPWWMAKGLILLIGCGFIILGVLSLLKMFHLSLR